MTPIHELLARIRWDAAFGAGAGRLAFRSAVGYQGNQADLRKGEMVMLENIPAGSADYDEARLIVRPDGVYWLDLAGEQQYGPFTTVEEAVADMQEADAALEVGETLAEAESEIGIADWIDPDTGEPAEEGRPRLGDNY